MSNLRYAAIDQGTTGTRVAVFEEDGCAHFSKGIRHKQITPQNGWVEHDALEILANITASLNECGEIDALGLAHQGESIVAWHKDTKVPIYNAIVWQDLRTEPEIKIMRDAGLEPIVQAKTGLPLDPYFSASKIAWILNNVPAAQQLLREEKLRFGTMDSFFIDALCNVYRTDYNSASRTALFNIHTQAWDPELCQLFGVPIESLPPIGDTIGEIGAINIKGRNIPLLAAIVDQFAGIYGHGCRHAGDAKITFGTGAFLQALTAEAPNVGNSGLLAALCWKMPNEAPVFGLDGGVYNAASALEWIRNLGLFNEYSELTNFSSEPAIARGIAFVPALSGLGCPYWDRTAVGLWAGLSLDIDRKVMIQSVLEGIAIRAAEVIMAMETLSPLGTTISIDGGLSSNQYFKQFLANLTGKSICVPDNPEVTALGTAMLARRGLGKTSALPTSSQGHLTEPKDATIIRYLPRYQEIIQRARGLRTL